MNEVLAELEACFNGFDKVTSVMGMIERRLAAGLKPAEETSRASTTDQ